MNNEEFIKRLHLLSETAVKNHGNKPFDEQYHKIVFFSSGEERVVHELSILVYVPGGNMWMHHYIREFSKYLDLGGLLETIEYDYEKNSTRVTFDNITFNTGWLAEYSLQSSSSNIDMKDLLQKFDYLIVEEI